MKIAVYTGSFDPITKGHLDIIKRASNICDEVIVAIGKNGAKQNLFILKDKIKMIELATGKIPNVRVSHYDGLLTSFMKSCGANIVIRGIRNTIDFEKEKILYCIYKDQMPEIEVVYLFASNDTQHISSSVVREMYSHFINLREHWNKYVPEEILEYINELDEQRYI